jgi:hypothetical protein
MTTEHQLTPEEEALRRLLQEKDEAHSEAARTVIMEALVAAWNAHRFHHDGLYLEEYDEAMDRMRLGAACITDSDHQLLAKLWRAALAAASSIDPDDETPVGHKVDRGNPRRFYRMLSAILETILQEKEILQQTEYAELKRKLAEPEPEDFPDGPY